jgi:hypothetical protein
MPGSSCALVDVLIGCETNNRISVSWTCNSFFSNVLVGMHKLIEVEEARVLMNVAKDWSVWRWLMEKKRVRAAADRAVDALSAAEAEVKAGWSDELTKAYAELVADGSKGSRRKPARKPRTSRPPSRQPPSA